ncbi:MAG: hypothetical protein D3906_17335, partial [Candidatus Electrothrix sp. AUS1_2]|nr:hypothetical protein [Candidatus Electrothrix sp. AUS1_2]
LNHAVESTILPLELIFEHRNYIPSFFLFLPVSHLVARMLYGAEETRLFRKIVVIIFSSLFLIVSGHATYTRNLSWASPGTLWSDAIRKAPESSRAAYWLGKWYRQFAQYQKAYYYFQRAVKNAGKAADPNMSRILALNGSASAVYMLGNHEQALEYYNQCLEIDKKDESCLNNRALAYLQLGQSQKALSDAVKLTQEYPASLDYQYLTASSAYLAGDYEIALMRMQKIAARSLNSHQSMYLTGILLMKKGAYPNSLFFLKQAHRLSPNSAAYLLTLSAAYYADKQSDVAEKSIQELLNRHSLPEVLKVLKDTRKNMLANENTDKFAEYAIKIIHKNL